MKQRVIEITYLLLRMVIGFLFLQIGGSKIFGWFNVLPPGTVIAPGSQMWIGGWMEIIGGILIMLGFFTHATAFLLAGMMAVAYWQFHFPNGGGWPIQNGGQPAVLFCFIFLYMAARGGGTWSLDALLFKEPSKPHDSNKVRSPLPPGGEG